MAEYSSTFDHNSSNSTPWQYKWKRPHLLRPMTPTSLTTKPIYGQEAKDMVPLHCSSARLTPAESREVLLSLKDDPPNTAEKNTRREGDLGGDDFSSDDDSLEEEEVQDCVLTVTILASRNSLFVQDVHQATEIVWQQGSLQAPVLVGDVVLLEVTCSASPSRHTEGSNTFSETRQQENCEVKLLTSRLLRWPGSALVDTTSLFPLAKQSSKTESGKNSSLWDQLKLPFSTKPSVSTQAMDMRRRKQIKELRKQYIGLTSLALCRKSKVTCREEENDALDVVRLMTLGMMPGSPNAVGSQPNLFGPIYSDATTTEKLDSFDEQNVEGEEGGRDHHEGDAGRKEKKSKLMLCCLTNEGKVHVFHALHLLNPNPEKKPRPDRSERGNATSSRNNTRVDNEDLLGTGFAAFLMGDILHAKVESIVGPLSHPVATVELSLVSGIVVPEEKSPTTITTETTKRLGGKKEVESHAQKNEKGVSLLNKIVEDDVDEEEDTETTIIETITKVGPIGERPSSAFLDLSLFDANIEMSTYMYRTTRNEATICASAFEYLAIGGRGVRKMRRKRTVISKLSAMKSALTGSVSRKTIPASSSHSKDAKINTIHNTGNEGIDSLKKVSKIDSSNPVTVTEDRSIEVSNRVKDGIDKATMDGNRTSSLQDSNHPLKGKCEIEEQINATELPTLNSSIFNPDGDISFADNAAGTNPFDDSSDDTPTVKNNDHAPDLFDYTNQIGGTGGGRRASAWWAAPSNLVDQEPPDSLDDKADDEDTKANNNEDSASWATAASNTKQSVLSTQHPKQKRDEEALQKVEWEEYLVPGGFVTFISLNHYSESRTLFLPFVPKIVSPIVWEFMQFVIILGDNADQSIAVRIDSSNVRTASIEGGRLQYGKATRMSTSSLASAFDSVDKRDIAPLHRRSIRIARFSPLPILMSDDYTGVGTRPRPVAVTSMLTCPPAIALSKPTPFGTVVTLYTIAGFQDVNPESLASRWHPPKDASIRSRDSIATTACHAVPQPGHIAHIPRVGMVDGVMPPRQIGERRFSRHTWCIAGQGWSLVAVVEGSLCETYFLSWEGATAANGAYVTKLQDIGNGMIKFGILGICTAFCNVLPTKKTANVGTKSKKTLDRSPSTRLPFTSSFKFSTERNKSGSSSRKQGYGVSYSDFGGMIRPGSSKTDANEDVDDIVANAVKSMRSLSYGNGNDDNHQSSIKLRRTWINVSHREKSEMLLRHCTSWTQLDDTKENRAMIDGQMIVGSVRFGPMASDCLSLTLRRNVVTNGVATPFQQVLSWLCQGKDYYTAASVALNLLHDSEAVRDLRASPGMTDEDEQSYLEGLLDGIIPLDSNDFAEAARQFAESKGSPRLSVNGLSDEMTVGHARNKITSLADMAVGCLVRGGAGMSLTLEGFLGRNIYYDASRACLMLVASAANAVSELRDSTEESDLLRDCYDSFRSGGHALWPIQCLLRTAVTRDCIPTALLLLNATVPDEMRQREVEHSNEYSIQSYRPSIDLCKAIVTMIVASSESAAGYLLNLAEESSNARYWESLAHDTRLALSLIKIRGRYPFLRESEVRAWVLEQVTNCVKSSLGGNAPIHEDTQLPSEWLRELCLGCLGNAGCDLSPILTALSIAPDIVADQILGKNDDGAERYRCHLSHLYKALTPEAGMGGIDFDLLISALLLLQQRSVMWRDGVSVTTEDILNAICDLAGLRVADEPHFAFDGVSAMQQCAIAGNVLAAAYLIGGRDGLVLKCTEVLMSVAKLSMNKAELILLKGQQGGDSRFFSGAKKQANEMHVIAGDCDFELTEGHRLLLRLLQEHVLSVSKYGEFDVTHSRGRVDPVFAARVCLRAWWCLMQHAYPTSGDWLALWLRERLGINPDGSKRKVKRLACAAFARALLWPDTSSEPDSVFDPEPSVVATDMGFDCKFLIDLCQACCGLVESVPPSIAEAVNSGENTFPRAPQ